MDVDKMKIKAEELKEKTEDLMNSPKVKRAVDKGIDALGAASDKAHEFMQKPEVQNAVNKGKEALNGAVDKLEGFVQDKTDGKGIFGFGEKK